MMAVQQAKTSFLQDIAVPLYDKISFSQDIVLPTKPCGKLFV